MGTRASIGYELEDGTVMSSYCHYDGYLAGVGAQLVLNYTDPEKIAELVALGSMSFLSEKIYPTPGSNHSFASPEEDVTVFYHRDRGESWGIHTAPTLYDSFDDWFEANNQQYNYLFVDGAWQCRTSSDFIVDVSEAPQVVAVLMSA